MKLGRDLKPGDVLYVCQFDGSDGEYIMPPLEPEEVECGRIVVVGKPGDLWTVDLDEPARLKDKHWAEATASQVQADEMFAESEAEAIDMRADRDERWSMAMLSDVKVMRTLAQQRRACPALNRTEQPEETKT